jgi:hypothetical protein
VQQVIRCSNFTFTVLYIISCLSTLTLVCRKNTRQQGSAWDGTIPSHAEPCKTTEFKASHSSKDWAVGLQIHSQSTYLISKWRLKRLVNSRTKSNFWMFSLGYNCIDEKHGLQLLASCQKIITDMGLIWDQHSPIFINSYSSSYFFSCSYRTMNDLILSLSCQHRWE